MRDVVSAGRARVGKTFRHTAGGTLRPKSARLTLITAARLLDGTGATPSTRRPCSSRPPHRQFGPRRRYPIPAGASCGIDYGAATILPGLVDAHTHLVAPRTGMLWRRRREGRRRHPPAQAAKNARTLAPLGCDHRPENGAKGRWPSSPRGHPPQARTGAADGHLRAADHDHGRAQWAISARGRRRDGRARRRSASSSRRAPTTSRSWRAAAWTRTRSQPRLVHRRRARAR
jgi:hypothetical protein